MIRMQSKEWIFRPFLQDDAGEIILWIFFWRTRPSTPSLVNSINIYIPYTLRWMIQKIMSSLFLIIKYFKKYQFHVILRISMVAGLMPTIITLIPSNYFFYPLDWKRTPQSHHQNNFIILRGNSTQPGQEKQTSHKSMGYFGQALSNRSFSSL